MNRFSAALLTVHSYKVPLVNVCWVFTKDKRVGLEDDKLSNGRSALVERTWIMLSNSKPRDGAFPPQSRSKDI